MELSESQEVTPAETASAEEEEEAAAAEAELERQRAEAAEAAAAAIQSGLKSSAEASDAAKKQTLSVVRTKVWEHFQDFLSGPLLRGRT